MKKEKMCEFFIFLNEKPKECQEKLLGKNIKKLFACFFFFRYVCGKMVFEVCFGKKRRKNFEK